MNLSSNIVKVERIGKIYFDYARPGVYMSVRTIAAFVVQNVNVFVL